MTPITIGRINNPRAAQAFCDYMKSQRIDVWYETHQDGQLLLLMSDPAQEDLACAELRSFLSNPDDPRYLDASWNQGNTDTPLSFATTASPGLKGFWLRAGPLTRLLTLICVIVTLLTNFGANTELTYSLMIADLGNWRGGLPEIMAGQWWRLVTPIFLHFMILHILFNMMWLWDLGGTIERQQSAIFLGFFVLSVGILSNLIQFISTGPAFGGMSGVVYGLLGYVWVRSFKQSSGYHLNSTLVTLMLIWLILGFTGILGPIGNAAHLTGLLLGVAYGFGWNLYE